MPTEWYKSVAKKSRKKTGKRTSAKKIKKYKKKALKSVPKGVKDPHAYATAVALRRAQKTGSKPHKKLSEGPSERTNILCPKCGSSDVLSGTGRIKNHCGECGEYWGSGGKPSEKGGKKHMHKEEATTTGGIGDVAFGGAPKRKRKRKKKTVKEYYEMIADLIDEDVNVYNPNDISDAMVEDDDVIESYNDNYLRPNQQDRRTKNRMSDGTSPAGAIETKKKRKLKKL